MTENPDRRLSDQARRLAPRRILEQIRRLPRQRVLLVLLLFTILAVAGAVWKLALPSEAKPPPKKIVFLGRQPDYAPDDHPALRLKKDHDQFHLAALSYHIQELEQQFGEDLFELEYHSNLGKPNESRHRYDKLADDPSTVLVVDNTWGRELQAAAEEIVEHGIPVISLNADKGTKKDFNNQVIFIGADDSTPHVLVKFLTEVLMEEEQLAEGGITFITEKDYPLKAVFEKVIADHPDLEIHTVFDLPGLEPQPDDVDDEVDKVSSYLSDDRARRRPIMLNVHGDWGSQLINALDAKHSNSGLTLLGGGSAVNEKFKYREFGVKSSNRLFINYSAAEDVISERARADMNRLRPDFAEFMASRNATLFLSRVREAATLIREALKLQAEEDEAKRRKAEQDKRQMEEDRRDAEEQGKTIEAERLQAKINVWKLPEKGPVTRGTFLHYMTRLAASPVKCVTAPYDLLDFDEDLVRKKDVQFVLHQNGEANSYLEQLDRNGTPIPNIRMGIQVISIYDIDVRAGDFGADFFFWTEQRKPAADESPAEELPSASRRGDYGAQPPATDPSDRTATDLSAKSPVLFKNLKEFKVSEKPITIEREGEVYRLHRLSGRFYTQYNIRDYPLDRQHLRIEAEVLNPSDSVRLSFDKESLRTTGVESGVTEVGEWSIEEFYITVDNKMGEALYGRSFPRECSQKFKHLTAHVIVKRRFADTFLTVVVPLVLIGLVAISLLFVRDMAFHAVGDAAIGVFLGIMAFLIALTDIAPDLSQISRGGLLFWSTFGVVVGVILVIVAVNSGLVGEKGQATIIRIGKIVIPALYVLAILLIPVL